MSKYISKRIPGKKVRLKSFKYVPNWKRKRGKNEFRSFPKKIAPKIEYNPDLKFLPYSEYLKTEHWSKLSGEVKKRALGRCQVCNSIKNLNAHHRSYFHKGEPDEIYDLICLCNNCHVIFHTNSRI
jgi:hypothetical protein